MTPPIDPDQFLAYLQDRLQDYVSLSESIAKEAEGHPGMIIDSATAAGAATVLMDLMIKISIGAFRGKP